MKCFITGTDTNVGKTMVSSWICAHTDYGYFKPIQTGSINGTDSQTVVHLAKTKIYPEIYLLKHPFSPHQAARIERVIININRIKLPSTNNLIIEGAGGLFVPINDDIFMIDLIKFLNVPVILVCRTTLGTINHTLLSIEALRYRSIDICGVIMSGKINKENYHAIEYYGQVEILGFLPFLKEVNRTTLLNITLSQRLKKILEVTL